MQQRLSFLNSGRETAHYPHHQLKSIRFQEHPRVWTLTFPLPFDRFTAFPSEPDRFRRQCQRQNSTRLHGRRQFHRSNIWQHVTDWAACLSDLFHTAPSDSANMITVSML